MKYMLIQNFSSDYSDGNDKNKNCSDNSDSEPDENNDYKNR